MKQNLKTDYKETGWLKIKRIKCHMISLNFKGKRILDIGCWWGWFIKYAREQGAQVDGFDYDINRIDDAIKFLGIKKGLCIASAEEIHCMTGSYDIVFSNHVLEHIENEDKMLTEIYGVLKEDGQLILSVPNDYSIGVLPYRPFRWLLEHYRVFLKRHNRYDWLKEITYSDLGHYREYTRTSICSLLERNRFRIISIRSYGFQMPYPIKARFGRKVRVYLDWWLGPVFPSFLRAEVIVHAIKM